MARKLYRLEVNAEIFMLTDEQMMDVFTQIAPFISTHVGCKKNKKWKLKEK